MLWTPAYIKALHVILYFAIDVLPSNLAVIIHEPCREVHPTFPCGMSPHINHTRT